ncbi:MAG: transporter related protein, partial [Thermomicrobiales bacterium]|nr:transporter related protein [Thermomicrobiales bacterium]
MRGHESRVGGHRRRRGDSSSLDRGHHYAIAEVGEGNLAVRGGDAARLRPDAIGGMALGAESGASTSIETSALTKRYGAVVALDGIDLAVPRVAVGLLGPNGAGKSTLLKILLGLTRPTSGGAEVLGRDAIGDGSDVRRIVGYMPETDTLPSGTTAADFVSHMAEMSGLPQRAARQRAADVLYHVGLDEERYRLISGFSTGMRQRVKLAQAIVHDPELVFLDEPTNGLDPQGREEMLGLIERIHRQLGILVVLSSHILDDIERVCDYVVVLDDGRVVASQSLHAPVDDNADLHVRVDGDPDVFLRALGERGIAARPAGIEYLSDEFVVSRDGDATLDA